MFFLFPYSIGRLKKKIPIITYNLIFFNVLIFAMTVIGDFDSIVSMLGYKVDQNAWYTWITHAFLHANILHLVGNMVFLYAFGSFLEDVLGEVRFLIVYVGSAFFSAVLFGMINVAFIPGAGGVPLVGASGAVAGLLGLSMIRFRHNDLYVFYAIWLLLVKWGTFSVKTIYAIMAYIAVEMISGILQILGGSVGGVGHWAHIGGLSFGIIAALVLGVRGEAIAEKKEDNASGWLYTGKVDDAADTFIELLKKDPNSAYYHYMSGKAHNFKDDVEPALYHTSKAIEIYLKEGDKEAAFNVYDEFCSYRKEVVFEPTILLALSSACQAIGQFEASIKCLRSFAMNYPADDRLELCILKLAQTYEKMGDDESADNVYCKFLSTFTKSEWTPLVKGRLIE